MTSKRLTKEDWLAAGFRALCTEGPTTLKAEVLARNLKTTKGSFYWHFDNLPAFKDAMLNLWREKVAGEIITDVLNETDKKKRLHILVEHAARSAPEEFGGRSTEPAMRAWALTDAKILEALNEMDKLRLEFVKNLLKDIGHDDPILAQLFYGAYIGLDDLASKNQADINQALCKLLNLIT